MSFFLLIPPSLQIVSSCLVRSSMSSWGPNRLFRREAVWLLGRSSTTVKPRVPVAYSKSPFLGPKMGSSRFDQPKTQRTKKHAHGDIQPSISISNWASYGSSWLLGSQGNDHINSYNICISVCVCNTYIHLPYLSPIATEFLAMGSQGSSKTLPDFHPTIQHCAPPHPWGHSALDRSRRPNSRHWAPP